MFIKIIFCENIMPYNYVNYSGAVIKKPCKGPCDVIGGCYYVKYTKFSYGYL